MSTAANHRKRSHRSESLHRQDTAKRYVRNIKQQDTGFGVFGAALRKWKKLLQKMKGKGKETNAGAD